MTTRRSVWYSHSVPEASHTQGIMSVATFCRSGHGRLLTLAKQISQGTVEKGYLIGLAGALAGHRFVIAGERTTIGRGPGQCDIVIELPVVSNYHAALEFDLEGTSTIKDLGSLNF